jgi:PAS domain S-box-containing protein
VGTSRLYSEGAGRIGVRPPAAAARVPLALAVAAQAALAVLDIADVGFAVTGGMFLIVTLALALIAPWRAVAGSAALSVVIALAGGFWNHNVGSAAYFTRLVTVVLGGVLVVLAARARDAAGVARREAEEERRQLELLAEVARPSGAVRLEEAVQPLAGILLPALGDCCWLDLYGPDGPRRLLARALGPRQAEVEAALAAAVPATSPDPPAPTLLDEPVDEALARAGLRSAAIVPVLGPGALRGALGVATIGPGRDLDAGDLRLLRLIAGRVALVLANARLLGELSSARAWLDGVLGSLAEAVTVQDEHGNTVYANDAAAQLLGVGSREDVLRARPGQLAARFDVTDEDGRPLGTADFPGARTLAGAPAPPLVTRTVDRETGRAYWLLTKASLLRDATGRYAVNIIEDITEAKQAELRERFLARAGQVLAASLDYEQTLQRIAQLAVPDLADWCEVDLLDEHGRIELVALAHSDPAKVAMALDMRRRWPPDEDGDTGLAAVARGGPSELYTEIADSLLEQTIADPEQLAATRALGMVSGMLVPMRVADQSLGAITFVSADSRRKFDADDLAFAEDLALRAATAVQNARLYAEQVRLAQTLQASLLPERLPELPGWAIAASYEAGEEGAEVGGDFYDIVPAGEGHLVFLGDVTGKGVDAAALTALVRHSVRTAARFDARPAAVLRLLNEILLDQQRIAPVTLVCALIAPDGEQMRMTLAAAGHPRPLLKRDGAVNELGRHGVLLGALEDMDWDEDTVVLEYGDVVVLYTDGVTDTPGDGDRFGPDRLAAVVAGAPDAPEGLIARLGDALRAFQVETPADDRAVLVLRYAGVREPESAGARGGGGSSTAR